VVRQTDNYKIVLIFIRYILIILIGLFNLKLLYTIFKYPTIYGSYFILKLFSNPVLTGNIITLFGRNFEIINACVIGTAYYLLFILLMSFQKVKYKTRIYAILTSFGLLYLVNITRIIFLISISSNQYFNQIHWIFWNIISTLLVIVIFIITIKIYKIKEIPFFNDLKLLYGLKHPIKDKK
jgi:exosortase/archaeosortase family protein